MRSNLTLRGLTACALACAPFLASCASSQYQAALDEREAENRALREERVALKGEMTNLREANVALESALADANARLMSTPDQSAFARDDELEDLGVSVGTRDGNVVYTVPSEITFASGKAELSSGGKQALAAVANRLQRDYPDHEYWVEGHTDSDPIKKSKFASNRDLSLARAMAVLVYLVDEVDMKDGQFVVAGWGEYRPVAGNASAGDKSRNRRVEIIVRRP
jgi:chemotaxis protein MotB